MFFKNKGILGINARNLLYIRPYNPKKAIKLADDKIRTKQFLSTRGIPVPKLYGIIKENKEVDTFDFNTLPNSFVIKPNQGFGGEGIIPILDKQGKNYITASQEKLTLEEIKDHIKDTLDGRFSISNVSDFAFFEQYIVADKKLGKYSYEGLPDIRVVVHNLIPVMAMLRLPTKESKGKANLHMGAVGVGIDIAKGETTYCCYKNKIIDTLPDQMGEIKGVKIPYWDEILEISSKTQLITNLGYLAADICIDHQSGPVLLEINARAGLGVQIANLAPLRKRLERIEGVKVTTPAKGVRIAKDMFGNIVEKEIQNLSGKEVIGTKETVEIIQKQGTSRIQAIIDTRKNSSIIDEETALQLGLLENPEDYDDEKSILKLKFSIKTKRVQTVVDVEKITNNEYKMIIGKRDLKDFLIDTELTKTKKSPLKPQQEEQKIYTTKSTINLAEIDQQINQIDEKIKLLYHLRPINLEEEKINFFSKSNYNPQFEYPQLKFDSVELSEELNKIKTDNSEMGIIFEEKKEEIFKKIHLLESINEDLFTKISTELYGAPSEEEKNLCINLLSKIPKQNNEEESIQYEAEEVKKEFEKELKGYNLNNWKVDIKKNMVADCVVGKNNHLLIKGDAKFTKRRIKALIVHEIETHILTAENGKHQPYEIFNRGLANYLITQEGLAIYNVEKQRGDIFEQNQKILSHVICIFESLNCSFQKTFNKLIELKIPKEQAFRSCVKAKRGFCDTSRHGAFTKDYIYYKGYQAIKNFTGKGGKIKDLYIGKINIKDMEKIKTFTWIKEPRILPHWLSKQ